MIHSIAGRGTFYLDNGHSFDYVLFYGNESLLFELELMLFLTLIVFTRHHLFSMFVVAIVYKVRHYLESGRDNDETRVHSIYF